ncbi:MAG: hypothetical protein R3Y63_04130 [Eubacteriales bacterium]
MNYSYEPLRIKVFGKDRMRFELGDTSVEGGEDTSALCDEEYEMMLDGVTSTTWPEAKLEILSAILHKMAFQVDTKIDTLSYDFSARVSAWETMYQDLKDEVEEMNFFKSMPSMGQMSKGHFWDGLHDNSAAGRW